MGVHVVQDVHDLQEARRSACAPTSSSPRPWSGSPPSAASASSTARTATSSATSRTRRIAAGPRRRPPTSRRPARTGRRRRRSTAPSSSAGSPTARCTSCISRTQARARAHQARAGARASACGRRRARSTCCSPTRRWQRWGPLRQDRPAAAARRRPGPRGAVGGLRGGLHRHRGERSLAARAAAEGAGLEEHLRRPRGQADPLRRARRSRRWCRSCTARAWSSAACRSRGWRACSPRTPRASSASTRARARSAWAPTPTSCICDPERRRGRSTWREHLGIAGWTLYEGWKARGRPWMTLLRGQVLLNRGRARAEARLRAVPRPARARCRRSAGPSARAMIRAHRFVRPRQPAQRFADESPAGAFAPPPAGPFSSL